MSKLIFRVYKPNTPAMLLRCVEGCWDEADRRLLVNIFGEYRVTGDLRKRNLLVVLTDPKEVKEVDSDTSFLAMISRTKITTKTKEGSGGESDKPEKSAEASDEEPEKSADQSGPIYGTLADVCSQAKIKPFFAHWPKARAPAPRKQTGTLDGYL